MTLTWISDPGHGWLVVPIAQLEALGIDNQISRYSFRHEATAYLEEDRDASLFLSALEDSGQTLDKLDIRHVFLPHEAPLRNYSRFTS